MRTGRLVIWQSKDGENEWSPVPNTMVPDWMRDKDVLGSLVANPGEMAQRGDSLWYRVEKLEDSPILIPHAPNLKHKTAVLQSVK